MQAPQVKLPLTALPLLAFGALPVVIDLNLLALDADDIDITAMADEIERSRAFRVLVLRKSTDGDFYKVLVPNCQHHDYWRYSCARVKP